jgi:AbrB family looped-hinge helix DNA binding protein
MSKTECKDCYCKINAIVTMDVKGQIVLPKDLREKAKLNPNEKLAIVGVEREGEVCCIVLLKADALGSSVKNVLGPVLENALK